MPGMKDPVRDYLRERGCGEHVIEGGLEGLAESWEKTVREVENGYSLTLDDYLNDLDARQLIADAMAAANDLQRAAIEARLSRADEKMRSLTTPLKVCLWGQEVANEEGWTAEKNWWYFARPIKADPELLAEIGESGMGNGE
ncbi:MAG: hypothetical protein J2P52_04155 [Blastocatellia bacterium]|nr:hypothetical protein [Blastocatellia bacterium]